ncbi:MAG TPA: Xaa-Pro peptidase family protein [Clostridia bacterium]|nr:Xaa-Pro peptidase family protein [Clostridia bacterium]
MSNADKMGNLTSRKVRITELMKEKGVKALVLSPSMNLLYTTGFNTFPGERLLAAILDDSGEIVFIAPRMYEQEVKEKAIFDRIISWDDSQDPGDILKSLCIEKGYTGVTAAIEDTMWFSAFEKIYSSFKQAKFIKASGVIGELRKYKTADEADKMRKSSELAEQALGRVIPLIKAGMKEIEVRDLLETEMKKQGLMSPSFETIIGSGSNSALPHYTAGDKVLKDGDSIVIDFGGMYQGYCSDMTRTVMLGKATPEYREVYETVREAQRRAAEAVKPGMKASEIDAAARNHITEKGYGEYFIHRTGHGIGMEVHEEPYISDISKAVLEPGMVFSIEPGIYLPGKFGVRIEDLVMVTETGVEVLNKYTKELIEI